MESSIRFVQKPVVAETGCSPSENQRDNSSSHCECAAKVVETGGIPSPEKRPNMSIYMKSLKLQAIACSRKDTKGVRNNNYLGNTVC